MSTSRQRMRVYNRRSKKGSGSGSGSGSDKEVNTRSDCVSDLPPKVLDQADLSVSELDQVAKLTRKQRTGQRRAQKAGGAVQVPTPAPAQAPATASWMDTIEGVLQHLQTMKEVKDVDIDVMMEFLVQEGITKAP